MIEIRPWLSVGKHVEATSTHLLEKNRILALLLLHQPIRTIGIETLFIPVQDGVPLRDEQLQRGIDFVLAQKAKGHHVLIACSAGVSRSPSFAIATLRVAEDLSLRDAFRAVRQRHPAAMPDQVLWSGLAAHFHEDISFWDIWRETLES